MGGLFIIVFIGVIIGTRFLAGNMDRERICSYIESRGGQFLSATWTPFGTGWYGEKNARIYEVRYRDRDRNLRSATCKTSALAGVYLTDDRVTAYAEQRSGSAASRPSLRRSVKAAATAPAEDVDALRAENEELRDQLARLESELADVTEHPEA